ncbi:glycosyltransferase family 25 protein [Serratia quinivorans]|uniref:glycosyltransferase family 25 protein n=1 Tax=Serratia quinivorans TaxID=137545 RepID=UPI0021784A11|nr:glycosyltransferase family 25 protein [Serratia quinivorans]CAI0764437.1 Glycosyltransferase family 25 (LPS biosynthesis protein) [Serratia quinivorans]CAI1565282.1 Glycosyltransferase family 25 (LPS biosynthesis protein) [Serratia quinivorans]
MIPIYVVSMEKDTDRRLLIERTFENLGLDFRFINAVVGKLLSHDELSQINFSGNLSRKGRAPTSGEIGCSLSHQSAYLDIAKHHEWGIILEDDAIIDERFKDFYLALHLPGVLNQFKQENLYLLGGQDGLRHQHLVALSQWGKVSLGGVTFSRAIQSNHYIYRTCCYLISRSMSTRMIELFANDFYIADEWAYFAKIGIIDGIYLSDFVSHPIELNTSSIEQERLIANANLDKNQSIVVGKNTDIIKLRIKNGLKKHFKLHYVKRVYIKIKLFLLSLRFR